MKIATAQYELKKHHSMEDYKNHVEAWVKEASDNQAKLLLFPEYGSLELVSLMSLEIQKNLDLQIQEMQSKRDDFISLYKNLAQKFNLVIIAPTFPWLLEDGQVVNRAFIFKNDGGIDYQDKQIMTRFEDEDWKVSSPSEKKLAIFEVDDIKCALNICFDVEFPDFAREVARLGVKVLLAPSCTETTAGMNRVHIGARARALENQFFVVVSQTVGQVDFSEAIDFNTGLAAIYTPCDRGFSDDGVLTLGHLNRSHWVYADLDLESIDRVRKHGAVLNFQKMLSL